MAFYCTKESLKFLLKTRSRFCFATNSWISSRKELPSSADVVVVGGGSIGCSTLYHLTKLGVTNAVLLEQHKLTAGSTWHAAGMAWSFIPDDTLAQISHYTRQLIREILPKEIDGDAGWIGNGGLFLAPDKERLNEYKRLKSLHKAFGIECELVSPSEIRKIHPLLNVDDVYAGLYCSEDGIMDCNTWCNALIKVARQNGAEIFEDCPVKGIETKIDGFGFKRVASVVTPQGNIETSLIIDCTGGWGPRIGKMVGLDIPSICYRHAYAVTEKIEGVRNLPNVRDHASSFYLRPQGEALFVGGYEQNPEFSGEDGVPSNDFSFGLHNIKWEDNFGTIIDAACRRLPALNNAGIASEICGPIPVTPDGLPLVGEHRNLKGFFSAVGFIGGLNMGGSGREVAHWATRGRPTLPLHKWDVCRFHPAETSNKSWLIEKTHEQFATFYCLHFPKAQFMAGRNVVKSPLHQQLTDAGCFYEYFAGWERPGWFDRNGAPCPVPPYDYYGAYDHEINKDTNAYVQKNKKDETFDFSPHLYAVSEEVYTCKNNVVAFDMSHLGKFYLIGEDSKKAAAWLFSNHIPTQSGQIVYSCLLNNNGGIEADLTLSNVSEQANLPEPNLLNGDHQAFYIVVPCDATFTALRHMENEIKTQGFRCRVVDKTNEIVIISIQGPKSIELLAEVAPEVEFANHLFPQKAYRSCIIAGQPCHLAHLSMIGDHNGYEIHVPAKYCNVVYQHLMKSGKRYGLKNAGYRALESLNLEQGLRMWNRDIRISDTPLEARLQFTCKLNSDVPFCGRAALEKQKLNGVQKKLIWLTIPNQVALFGWETIVRDGMPVGYTVRGDYSYTVNAPLACGYVSNPTQEPITDQWIRSGSYKLDAFNEGYAAKVFLKSPFTE